jgi:hypothetical protein
MKYFKRSLKLLFIWVILTSCSSSRLLIIEPTVSQVTGKNRPDTVTDEPAIQITTPLGSTPFPQESNVEELPVFTPLAESRIPENRTKYRINAILDYANHHLSVDESIVYTNRSQDIMNDLMLIIEPSRYPDTFQLRSMTWGNGQAVGDYQREVGQILIDLSEHLAPGEQVKLNLKYELQIPSPDSTYYGRPVPFGYSARQTNLVDWYPFVPPYLKDQGWLVHQAGFFGEHLVYESSDFDVSIELSDPTLNLTIAASAPAEKEGPVYHYQHLAARNFAWSVSDLYELLTKQVGDITVMGYAFPIHAQAGEAALETTAQALDLYSQLFGPYPHGTLSVVEADFLDGMEYDGLYFLSNGFYTLYRGTQAEYLVTIAAHETAHQWFYGLVANDQAMEPWLDEALCTYSERLYYEHFSPQSLEWWTTYRIQYYQPHGWVDGSIYNPEGYRAYRDAIYLNGALFLDDLRMEIGDEVFLHFLRDYVTQFSYQVVQGKDFFNLLETQDSIDIRDLVSKYFSRDY